MLPPPMKASRGAGEAGEVPEGGADWVSEFIIAGV
jgi:hypothetical protein